MDRENLLRLLQQYQNDEETLLRENPGLENLYVFSNQREGAIEWIDFRENASILVINDEFGSHLSPLFQKNLRVTVLVEDEFAEEFIRTRFPDREIRFISSLYEAKKEKPAGDGGEYSFDYIIFLGNEIGKGIRISDAGNIGRCRKMLNPDNADAKLVLAFDNRFGIMYLSGSRHTQDCMSKNELCGILKEIGCEEYHFYYPLYDYRLLFTLFSDRYLPSKGEVARYLPAYNYPKFLNTDIAAELAKSTETGDFTSLNNSYIVLVGKAEEAIYIKYNRTRKKEYRIKTSILERNGKKVVAKTALTKESKGHIASLREKYDKLLKENPNVNYLKGEYSENGESAFFPFVKGRSLTAMIGENIVNGELPADLVKDALESIIGQSGSSNHDAIFDNFLLPDEDKETGKTPNGVFTGIDYEWVETLPLEKKYLWYRALKGLFESFSHRLEIRNESDILSLFSGFGITEEDVKRYERLERDFQEKVHGDTQKIYLDNYFVTPKTDKFIYHLENQLIISRERERGIKAQVADRDATIKKMTKVKRLTDNHVVNLEKIIADLRHENTELIKSVHHLQKHEALIYRAKRKIVRKLDEAYPQGSAGRRNLKAVKLAVKNPKEFLRLHTTKEGQLQLAGESKIGEDFAKHGKLMFPYEDAPKVSIVIPVYNQIHYTYACLVSILEHTKDVSYEVIIADDVSTDATKELSDYTKNLVISRNETNQGFVKNCNQAAAKARGKYIMFLNNDTKVTKNWLSSLVELMEKDASIGMTGSKLIYPDGRLQEAGGILWSDGSGWNYGRLDDPDQCEYNYVKEVDYISGAAILIGRSLWEQIGGFDTRYAPAYCEDSDLAFEVRKAGYKVVLQPKSVVIHFEGISNGTDVQGTGLKRYQVENSVKLREKWAKEFAKQGINDGNPDPFRARERSFKKKMVLFVDHYVPTVDKDAGSKTTFQYLKMLIKQGFVVKFLGDNFAKEEPYTSMLENMGIEVLYGQKMQVEIWDWIRKHEKDIHVAYLNRPHIASKYIDFIKDNTKIKVVYYGHDLHFLRLRREYELNRNPKTLEESEYWKGLELNLMYKADMSYYPSQIEVDAVKDIDPEISIKAITAYVYDEFKDVSSRDYEKNEGLLFVGGFSHPPNADAVKWFVNAIFPKIRAKKKINFYIVGSNATEEIKNMHNPDAGIVFKGFVSDEELERLYDETKMVVVPLRYGAGVKGKVVEALYNGCAIVTTSVGAEGIPRAGHVLHVEDTEDGFAKTVLDLYDNPQKIKEISLKSVEYIKENNSCEGAYRIIRDEFA